MPPARWASRCSALDRRGGRGDRGGAGRRGTIARALLPGPYALVLPNPAKRFAWLCGETPEAIGVRVPQLGGPGRDVLDRVGALAATSANLAGGPEPRPPQDV